MTIVLFSCEKQELEFSCDPEINRYVKDNKKSFADFTLKKLNSYDISLQRAIFNSWSYSKKNEIWLEKLSIVKQNEIFNDDETSHINKLIDHFNENYFHQDNRESFYHSLFAKEWIAYAIMELGWDEKFIAFMVYRLYTDPVQLDEEVSAINELNELISTGTEGPDCGCNTTFDYCGYSICTTGNCNTVGGCGWLWSYDCNGECY
jgi:hypothetical protein